MDDQTKKIIDKAAELDGKGGSSVRDFQEITIEDMDSVRKCAFIRGAKFGLKLESEQVKETLKKATGAIASLSFKLGVCLECGLELEHDPKCYVGIVLSEINNLKSEK